MKYYTLLLLVVFFAIMACKSKSPEEVTQPKFEIVNIVNEGVFWKLTSPSTGTACELALSFGNDNKMLMNYRGQLYEGYYEVDSVFTKYIKLNIFNKQGGDEECPVNPEYLTLYDSDTQFSYTIVGDKLYLQRTEKVIVFERVEDQKI